MVEAARHDSGAQFDARALTQHAPCAAPQVKRKGEPSTLYCKGRILGYKRCAAWLQTPA